MNLKACILMLHLVAIKVYCNSKSNVQTNLPVRIMIGANVMLEPLLIYGLFRAFEKLLEKGLDAAYSPAEQKLKNFFDRIANKSELSKRRDAFASAQEKAFHITISKSSNPQQAKEILTILVSELDQQENELFSVEVAKTVLFADHPNVEHLADLCN